MTPLRERDPRFMRRLGGEEDERRVKASGYAGDVALQIPGEVRALVIVDHRIRVDFVVERDSTICKRSLERKNPCPEPGPYRWTLSWRPGELTQAGEAASAKGKAR